MNTTVITSKGTTTIPKEIRQHLGIAPGSSVNFTIQKDGKVIIERIYSLEEIREINQKYINKKNKNLFNNLDKLIEEGLGKEILKRNERSKNK